MQRTNHRCRVGLSTHFTEMIFIDRGARHKIQLTPRSIEQKYALNMQHRPQYKRVLQKEHVRLYDLYIKIAPQCRFAIECLEIQEKRHQRNTCKITRSSFKQIRIEKYINIYAIGQLLQPIEAKVFLIRREDTHHEIFAQSSRMSYILICVRVALATSVEYYRFTDN